VTPGDNIAYSVGAAGAAWAGGTSGLRGGNGAPGLIVIEY
jgi:hypothetical protein